MYLFLQANREYQDTKQELALDKETKEMENFEPAEIFTFTTGYYGDNISSNS